MSIKIGGFELALHFGDVYLRVPRWFDLAWNSTGFYVSRLSGTSQRSTI
ncbi:hypothetical protein [Billgrantia antri]|uniref:Uncharacterized protein n=1 Tax=Billgrantia antri TaxID=2846777 RepID=A0ABS6ZP14_9GAMM|nr:hypothetical protein [Halomonas antri]MBW6391812.1 hypothetical protein [Halomonas antri]